jgi:hypothetical protein
MGADVDVEGLGVRTAEVDAVEFVSPANPGLRELYATKMEAEFDETEERNGPFAGAGLSAEEVEVVSTASGMVMSLMMSFSGLSLYCQEAWLVALIVSTEKTWLVR